MADFHVRQALLDDTTAISKLARSRVGVWQRLGSDGQVETVAYDALSIYERWLHGGPWMSVETGAMQLSHLLRGAGNAIVAEQDGRLVGYVESYTSTEPQPYGFHEHLGLLAAYTDAAGADDALFQWLVANTHSKGIRRITANCPTNDDTTAQFYQRQGMAQLEEVRRMVIETKSGQVFYKAVPNPSPDATQINGWFLKIGRLGSSRYQWESLWHRTWDAIPEIKSRKTHRLHFNAAGNEAFVLVQQQLYRPRIADVTCWTPKPPSGQLITAIRDWAQQEGYRKLVMPTATDALKTLGLDAEPDGYREIVYARDV